MKNVTSKPELRVSDSQEKKFNMLSDTEKEMLQYWFHKLAHRQPYQKIGKFMVEHFSTQNEPISSLMDPFKNTITKNKMESASKIFNQRLGK